MVAKRNSVDSIVAPTVEDKKKRPKKGTESTLLSIIEPDQAKVETDVDQIKSKPKKIKQEKTKKEKKPKPEITDKLSVFKKNRKILVASGAVLAVLILITGLIGGGVYAHQAIYENKVFPGVIVWGEDAGGKSMAEVQAMINEKVKNYNVVIKGPDQDYTATSTDLGVVFNSETMALSAFSRGRTSSAVENYLVRARLLAAKIPVEFWQEIIRADDLVISPSYTVNEEIFNAYIAKVADNINITAQDSEVKVASGQVQLKPAIYGREVLIDDFKNQVRSSIEGLKSAEIIVETTSVRPEIIDDAAQEVMIQAQNVMKRPVVLTYKGQEYRPNQETVASWISFIKNTGDLKYTLTIDTEKMKNYFDFLGTKINIYPVSRKIRVENGVKETEIQPGSNGMLIDTGLLGKTIANLLPSQASVTLEIPTYVAQYKTEYERVVIADWDKYIDINLSAQTMTACEKGGVNCRQWQVTTGDDNHSTPTGTFLVLGRNASFYMTGGTPGVDYYKVWVDYAVWFTPQGHAIHDAEWRNGVFGGQDYHWNGSHGCVNSPDDAAVFVYNWAAVGTPVIIHY